ncbi:MAG: hypothetical protein CME64_06565 [Halobacteriovoraceae bacterium]|nr:hypothetical protein [Halobacteriovoraceae bacterium]|tara:strand:+ start:38906 stop:39613 length:708 start_codon:yes stop_codon:yes gene_type:complete
MKLIALLIMTFSTLAQSQDFSYPELNVVPRATERIKMEVRSEEGHAWKSNMALQIASIMTLTTGFLGSSNIEKDKEDDYAAEVSMAVGAGWLAATVWASMNYRPYRSAYVKMRKMPYKTKREKLLKERIAEEKINSLRSIGKKIRWAGAITNLAASLNLQGAIDDETDEGKRAKTLASVSAAVSLASFFFPSRWEEVADEQEKYKKKIYSPVSLAPAIFNTNKGYASGLALAWNF